MLRQPLLAMLDRYLAAYPDESATVTKIRALVTSSADCFHRTCRPGHVTGSAWVLSDNGRRCLLVHHRKLDRWLQPGGHADGESDIAQVALREVTEEAGLTRLILEHGGEMPLDVDVHRIPPRFAPTGNMIEDGHEHHDLRFLVRAAIDEPLVVSDESHDVRWFTREELLRVTDEESILRMFRKAGPRV